MDFGVAMSAIGDVQVVEVWGELDIHTAPQLDGPLAQSITPGARVIINGEQLVFTDSSGVGVFVKGHAAAQEVDGWLGIAVTSDQVIRILTIAGLMDILNVYRSLDEALAAGR